MRRKLAELWDSQGGLKPGTYVLRVSASPPNWTPPTPPARLVCELWQRDDGYQLKSIVGAFQVEMLRLSGAQAEMAAEYEAVEALRKVVADSDRGALPVLNTGRVGPAERQAQREALEAARSIVGAFDSGDVTYTDA